MLKLELRIINVINYKASIGKLLRRSISINSAVD